MRFILIFTAPFLLGSCANTYVFNSVNNPFLDSSRYAAVKLLTSLDSKQGQATVRIYKDWMAGGTVFYNKNANSSTKEAYSRFSYDFSIAKNFYPFKNSLEVLGLSVAVGLGSGNTNYPSITPPFLYQTQKAASQYENAYLQLGLSYQRRRIALNAFYKFNFVHFNLYYSYLHTDRFGGKSSYSSGYMPAEVYEFKHKESIMNECVFQLLLRPRKVISFIAETGFSLPVNLFNAKELRRKDWTETHPYYDPSKNRQWANNTHPNYTQFIFRLGIQCNMGSRKNK